ncbi:MAG: VCBS repeat-containing protein [Thermoanaerobaculia bacterium]
MYDRNTVRKHLLPAVVCILASACSGSGGSESEPAADTLDAGAWPTETLSSAASATKKRLLSSIEEGSLDAEAARQIFTADFRGEDFHQRPRATSRIESGISLAEWADTPADLEAESFRQRWNAWLEELGEVQSLEAHTWEIQLRPQTAGRGPGVARIETREAVWILGRLADGRLREERLYLILDLVREREGAWKIAGVGSDSGRTAIAPGPFFRDVTARVLPPGSDQIGAQIYTDGGPVLADFDADGDVDLFLPRLHAPARLYENDGSGHFEDATAARGLELNALRQGSNSGLFVDVDRDGRLDLLVGLKQRGLLVLKNDGSRFLDATAGEPLAGVGEWESLAAADYDGDGWVDVYITNYGRIDADHQPESYVDAGDGLANVLLRNLGRQEDGRWLFEDVTVAAGMEAGRERWSYAAAWADYDRDGDLDLYVANDYGPNSLYRNHGGGFEEVGEEVGAADYGNGMGMSWADVDGDLWLDAYVSNMQSFAGNRITRLESFPGTAEERALFRRFSKGNTLLRNRGPDADGIVTFEDISEESAAKGAFWAWGNLAFDYDSDADLDLFVCGGFYTGVSAKDT